MAWPSTLAELTSALPRPGEVSQNIPSEQKDGIRFLVSSLQRALRRERQRRMSPNPKTCFLVLLVRYIFLSSMPQFKIWESAQIALPMHPRAHVDPLAQHLPTTSTASLLLFSPITKFPPLHTPPPSPSRPGSDLLPDEEDSASELSNIPGYKRTAAEWLNMTPEDFRRRRTQDEADTDAKSALYPTSHSRSSVSHPVDDYALEAHMLSCPDDLSAPLLCLFCMADTENIVDAVASALHQRRVWGVTQPIAGLAFDPFETTVQVVFGWFESCETDLSETYSVPLPSIVYSASEDTAKESGGVFDLSDIRSAELLFTFLVGIQTGMQSARSHGEAVANEIFENIKCQTIPLWRSDGLGNVVDEDEIKDHGNMWREHIDGWVEGVKAALDQGRSKASEDETAMAGSSQLNATTRSTRSDPSHKQDQEETTGDNRSNATLRSSSNRSMTRTTPSPVPSQAPSLPRLTESAVVNSISDKDIALSVEASVEKQRTKRYSASELAKGARSSKDGDHNYLTNMWLLDRGALTYSLPPARTMSKLTEFEVKADHLRASLRHFKTYDDMTAFYFPSVWERKRPPVPEYLDYVLSELLAEKTRRTEDVGTGRLPEARELRKADWLLGVLESKITNILLAVVGARSRLDAARDGTVSELEWRFSWDLLAQEFFDGTSPDVSYMLERTLNLPRMNLTVIYPGRPLSRREQVAVDKRADAYRNKLVEERDLALDESALAEEAFVDNPSTCNERAMRDADTQYRVARAVLETADSVIAAWNRRRTQNTKDHSLKLDPITARCDGLGSLRIPSFFPDGLKTQAKRFVLVRNTLRRSSTGDKGTVEHMLHRTFNPEIVEYWDVMRGAIFPHASHSALPTTGPPTLPATSSNAASPEQHSVPFSAPDDPSSLASDLAKMSLTSGDQDRGEGKAPDKEVEEEEEEVDPKGTLHVPIFFNEYKKRLDSGKEAAANQNRLDAVAGVKFLATLGITDFPVFGLVTEGPIGVVTCAWGVRDENGDGEVNVHIADRLGRGFDISTALGAFNYATFLAKLSHDYAPFLLSKFENGRIKEEVVQGLKMDAENLRWKWNMGQIVP